MLEPEKGGSSGLCLADTETRSVRRLLGLEEGEGITCWSISEDGNRIAIVVGPDSKKSWSVSVLDSELAERFTVIESPRVCASLDLSADGRRLGFTEGGLAVIVDLEAGSQQWPTLPLAGEVETLRLSGNGSGLGFAIRQGPSGELDSERRVILLDLVKSTWQELGALVFPSR